LSLGGNQVTDYSDLEELGKTLTNLVQLDLEECPISQKEDYRKKLFEMFKGLKVK